MRQLERSGVLLGLLLAALVAPSLAQAAECVTPKARQIKGGLERTWISIFTKPDPKASVLSIKIAAPISLVSEHRQGGFVEIQGGPSEQSFFKPGVILGWVRASQVDSVPYRNCAF